MVIDKKSLGKVLVKHDGSVTKAAKEIGISEVAIHKRLRRDPHLKKQILNVREEALKRSGLSRAFVYRGIKQGCQARVVILTENRKGQKVAKLTNIADHGIRHRHLKTALELHKDLDPDKEQSVQNIGAIIFQVLTNPNRERISVV